MEHPEISICSREKKKSTSFGQSADIPDELPRYVRFDTVKICQSSLSDCKNGEWCAIYSELLHKLHPAFVRSSLMFKCYVSLGQASFPNGSILLSYLNQSLLPIFAHCRSYKFVISFFSSSGDESDRNFITSILKFSQIKSCPSVKIRVVPSSKPAMIQPEAISDFLYGQSGDDQLPEIVKAEKFLKIECYIHNFSEIIDHLKQVIKCE